MIDKIKVTDQEKEEIKKNSVDRLPLNPSAQGYSGAELRKRFAQSITGEKESVLALIIEKLNLVGDIMKGVKIEEVRVELNKIILVYEDESEIEIDLTPAKKDLVKMVNDLLPEEDGSITINIKDIPTLQKELDDRYKSNIVDILLKQKMSKNFTLETSRVEDFIDGVNYIPINSNVGHELKHFDLKRYFERFYEKGMIEIKLSEKLDKNFKECSYSEIVDDNDIIVLQRATTNENYRTTILDILSKVDTEIFIIANDGLPDIGIPNKIYLVPRQDEEFNNFYDEFLYKDGKWEQIGSVKIDLSNYYTKEEVDSLLIKKYDKSGGLIEGDVKLVDNEIEVTGGNLGAKTRLRYAGLSVINGTNVNYKTSSLEYNNLPSEDTESALLKEFLGKKYSLAKHRGRKYESFILMDLDDSKEETEIELINSHFKTQKIVDISRDINGFTIPNSSNVKKYVEKYVSDYVSDYVENNPVDTLNYDLVEYMNYASSIYYSFGEMDKFKEAWEFMLTLDENLDSTVLESMIYNRPEGIGFILPLWMTIENGIKIRYFDVRDDEIIVISLNEKMIDNYISYITGKIKNAKIIINDGIESIGQRMFYRCIFNYDFVIPKTVNVMGEKVFEEATLTNLVFLSETPPTFDNGDNGTFDSFTLTGNIYVPNESVDLYISAIKEENLKQKIKPMTERRY